MIAWIAVVLGINSTSNAGSNFHKAKLSEISCSEISCILISNSTANHAIIYIYVYTCIHICIYVLTHGILKLMQ